MSELQPQPSAMNKFSPCGDRCLYVDAILASPNNDLRLRSFESGQAVVWQGREANDGVKRNLAGQHVEYYLDCDIAVYEIDYVNHLLRQWHRDVETGRDLEMMWEISLDPFFTELFDLGILNLFVHKSYGGYVAAHSGDRVAFYDVTDGSEIDRGYLERLGSFETDKNYVPTNPQRFSDMLWFSNGFVAISPVGNTIYQAPGDPPILGPAGFFGNLALTFGKNAAPFEGDPSHRTPTYRVSVCGDEAWSQHAIEPFVHTQWARFGQLWGYGREANIVAAIGASEYPDRATINRTTSANRSDPCGHDYSRVPVPEQWRNYAWHVASSAFCGRIYHWSGEDTNLPLTFPLEGRILRYDIEADNYQVLGSTGFGNDFPDVVADTWPLPDGVPPEFRCVDRCRDAVGEAEEPLCCGPDDPFISANFADTQYPSDCFSEPYPGIFQYAIHALAIPQGCPGDRVTSITLAVYGDSGGNPFAELCYSDFYRDDFDDSIMYADWGIYLRPGECYEMVLTSTTEQGCINEITIRPYISPPECDIQGGTPIRLL